MPDEPKCPHCGSIDDPFFSRTEPMGFFCPSCGKDVDATPLANSEPALPTRQTTRETPSLELLNAARFVRESMTRLGITELKGLKLS